MIIAHRGSSFDAPENTLAAFAQAMAQGADGIEFDVQLTADGIPIVIHDLRLRRTTGQSGLVRNLRADDLPTLDVGSWFNRIYPRRARPEYENERLPTLDEVFLLVRSKASAGFISYVEIKINKRDRKYHQLVEAILESVEAHRLGKRTVLVSFNLDALGEIKRIDPAVRTGALFEPRALTPHRKLQMIEKALSCGADQILLHRLSARERLIQLAARRGLTPVVWTVDDTRWVARAAGLGLHAIITNQPAKFVTAFGSDS